jgi:hypothetical protein
VVRGELLTAATSLLLLEVMTQKPPWDVRSCGGGRQERDEGGKLADRKQKESPAMKLACVTGWPANGEEGGCLRSEENRKVRDGGSRWCFCREEWLDSTGRSASLLWCHEVA